MGYRYEIRLSGSGGQGLILIGIILAETIGVYEGLNVVQTQSYGPEARGGASKAELVVSDEEIDYPKPQKVDLLLAMNQASCDLYYRDLKEDGKLLVDSSFVSQVPTNRALRIPFTKLAREQLGREIVANIVALGALSEITNVISFKNLELALLDRVPKGTENINKKALRLGRRVARKMIKEMKEIEMEDYTIDESSL
jgi:2-oxoglutarate ferredoxin oxidoreductase subunit gamma